MNVFPRVRLPLSCAIGILAGETLLSAEPSAPTAGLERFYIGTYSGAIYQATLDLGTGAMGMVSKAATIGDPSFVALAPNRNFVYAVNEGGGTVGAFSVNPTNGVLKLLNQRSSNGGAPAHLVVDRSGRTVIVANYNGGSATVFPILTNGMLGAATAHVQHPGPNPLAHCITLDAANRFAFVTDKGLDQIRSYHFDSVAGTLVTNNPPFVAVAKGSGPRHLTFEPQYKRAYVICELSSTIIGFDYNGTNGVLASFQTVSTLPPGGLGGVNTAAEIVVHPSGTFVYGSNRGKDSIAVFTVDPANGMLTPVQQQATGRTPRNFAIDPTGAFCFDAGQNSNDVRLYRIDPRTGFLTDTGNKLAVSAPVCIVPFILQPPQPILATRATGDHTSELTIANSLAVLTYQLFETTQLPAQDQWNLLATGEQGQTNFLLTNALPQEFFQVRVSTNY